MGNVHATFRVYTFHGKPVKPGTNIFVMECHVNVMEIFFLEKWNVMDTYINVMEEIYGLYRPLFGVVTNRHDSTKWILMKFRIL